MRAHLRGNSTRRRSRSCRSTKSVGCPGPWASRPPGVTACPHR